MRLVRLDAAFVGTALAFFALACGEPSTDEAPAAALRAFLQAMDHGTVRRGGGEFEIDEEAMREAYALLDTATREELARRAELASSLSGQSLEPWQMIPPGRYRLRFEPRRYVVSVDGVNATVEVHGDQGQRATVRLVREAGGWRVPLALPRSEAR